jgi:hypothetical protein
MISPLRNELTSGSGEAADDGGTKSRRKESNAQPFEAN